MSLASAIRTGDVADLPSRRDEDWRWTDLRGLIRAVVILKKDDDGDEVPRIVHVHVTTPDGERGYVTVDAAKANEDYRAQVFGEVVRYLLGAVKRARDLGESVIADRIAEVAEVAQERLDELTKGRVPVALARK